MYRVSLCIIVLLFCCLKLNAFQDKKEFVTPEMYGAVGNGIVDDTRAIMRALESPFQLLLTRTYLVTDKFCDKKSAAIFKIPQDKTIQGRGKIISTSTRCLFLIHSVSDVNIQNLELDFSKVYIRTQHSPSNHGIVIVNSSNIKISGLKIKSTKGDGIYIGSYNDRNNHNESVEVRDVDVENFNRQGIAVVEGSGIKIRRCSFINRETSFFGGVDIEPNHAYEAVEVRIDSCTFINCGINTYRAHAELNRNIKIVIEGNQVRKQMHLVGGVGTHTTGISIQDANSATVCNNDVSGFVGISAYNCDSCTVSNNQISSAYRGIIITSVDQFSLLSNHVNQIERFDFLNDKKLNPYLVKESGTTIEIISSDGSIEENFVAGRVWVRNSSNMIVRNNFFRRKNGAMLLNMNGSNIAASRVEVINNICEAEGNINPIAVLQGNKPIEFLILNNTMRKNSKGILTPNNTRRSVVERNVIM